MYKRTIWQDHVEGIQEGTDMNAANFNNLEAGTMEANALAALNASYCRYGADVAKNSEVFSKSATLSGSGVIHSVSLDGAERNTTQYQISYEIVGVGAASIGGDIVIMSKQANGFQVKYIGTSSELQVIFYIAGGMI